MRRSMTALGMAAMMLVPVLGGLASAGPPTVQITITKTVVGTDPGVAFAITLTCDSEGGSQPLRAFDFQIPNDGEQSEVVNLRHGESTTVNVTLPNLEPDLATCRVSEDLSGVTLPAGITCTPSVTPESVVVYDGDPHDGEFTVTNTCSGQVQAVQALATTTG